jgi:hypothetical protein
VPSLRSYVPFDGEETPNVDERLAGPQSSPTTSGPRGLLIPPVLTTPTLAPQQHRGDGPPPIPAHLVVIDLPAPPPNAYGNYGGNQGQGFHPGSQHANNANNNNNNLNRPSPARGYPMSSPSPNRSMIGSATPVGVQNTGGLKLRLTTGRKAVASGTTPGRNDILPSSLNTPQIRSGNSNMMDGGASSGLTPILGGHHGGMTMMSLPPTPDTHRMVGVVDAAPTGGANTGRTQQLLQQRSNADLQSDIEGALGGFGSSLVSLPSLGGNQPPPAPFV